MKKKKDQQKRTYLILGVVGMAVVVFGGGWLYGKKVKEAKMNEVQTEMVEDKEAERAVLGSWVWVETEMGDETIIRPNSAGDFWLNLNEDEPKVVIMTDCNNASGTFTVWSNGEISFGAMMSTQMFCEGAKEDVFLGQIGLARTYLLDENGLHLAMEADSGIMHFVRAEEVR